jgi:thiamine-phosphate pyrophosphorylase
VSWSVPVFYPIIDTALCRSRGLDPLALAGACVRGGARWLQLRAKDESSADLVELADALVAIARRDEAHVIINDRADVAAMSHAAGVHIGQDDLDVEDVRGIVGQDAVVGVSTHDPTQVQAALTTSASYVAVGPMFATATKETGYDPRGFDLVRQAAARGKPIVAIGGITLETAPQLLGVGATGVAVISDLLVGDPEERVRQYLRTLKFER